MGEKRFICGLGFPINSDDPIRIITDKETNKDYFKFSDICEIMNKQQATIQQLQAQLREKEEDEQLYANEIVKLNKEAKEVLDFKSLGGDY